MQQLIIFADGQTPMADEILRGQVDDFRVRKPDGWCVLTLFIDTGKIADVTGVFPEHVAVGDTIEVCGKYTTNNFGTQFKASHMLAHQSGSPSAVEQWLMLNLPNIGEVRAKALTKQFGSDIWHTIETNPLALSTVPGITAERAGEIVEAYKKVRNQRDYVLKLTGAGLAIKDAAAIMSELGSEAFTILEGDPYAALLRRRIPFEQADKVAQELFAVTPQDPRRVRAFAQRELFQKTYTEGHCYMMLFELVRATSSALKVRDSVVESALVDYASIIIHNKRAFLLEIDEAENVVASAVRRLLEQLPNG